MGQPVGLVVQPVLPVLPVQAVKTIGSTGPIEVVNLLRTQPKPLALPAGVGHFAEPGRARTLPPARPADGR